MKKLLLAFLLVGCCLDVYGQHIRLTDTTNTWRVYCDGGGTEYYSVVYSYRFNGDTVMYGNSYKRLTGAAQVLFFTPSQFTQIPPAGTYYFREDTLAGQVWCRSGQTSPPYAWERLIYNAAWGLNDTIETIMSPGRIYNLYINGIDSTQIAGQWHKVFRVKNAGFPTPGKDYFDIVEGLGSTTGPAYTTGDLGGEYNIQLQCFYNSASKPLLNPALNNLFNHKSGSFSNAGPCKLAVNDLLNGEGAFLSPNPATSRSKIMLPYSILQGRLIIYNGYGQTVCSTVITNSAAIPLPAVLCIPGLYYYRVTDQKGGPSFTGRFVYE